MKNNLRQLLAEGKTDKALDALLNTAAVDSDDHNMVLQLAARHATNERQRHAGTLAQETYNLERNKINEALLAVIGRLPDTAEKTGATTPQGHQPAIIQRAEKIYNIDKIDKADFS